MDQQRVYRSIVENARAATEARWVQMTRHFPELGVVRQVAWSDLGSPILQRAMAAVRARYPGFAPEAVEIPIHSNPVQQAIYSEGRTISTPLSEVARGVVDDRILWLVGELAGMRHVLICPLSCRDDVAGALIFHSPRRMTDAQERTCEAFARQAALTLENEQLVQELRVHLAELQRARGMITEAQERLRQDIAEELHGRVQTRLLVVWHRLGQSLAELPSDPAHAAQVLEAARADLDTIREQDVRRVSHRLHPAALQLGLIPALQSLVFDAEPHAPVELRVEPDVRRLDDLLNNRIPAPVRLALFRCAEVTLGNAMRHAAGAAITLKLERPIPTSLQLSISDEGPGCDPAAVPSGLGFHTISNYIEALQGHWTFHSTPGEGTRVTVTLSIEPGEVSDGERKGTAVLVDVRPRDGDRSAEGQPLR